MSTTATPSGAGGTLDFGRGFTFVPEDPDWIKKILIGGVFTLLGAVLVGTVFVAGYAVRLLRRAAAGEPRPLPEWSDLGGMFVDGLRAMGVYLVILIAAAIVPGALGCVAALAGSGMAALGEKGHGLEALAALAFMGFYVLMAVALLLVMLYFPAALTRFVLLGRMGAAFEVRETVDFIRRNLANYALALVLYLVASFAAQFGVLLCCVGLFPASFWAVCVGAWSLGEVARRDPYLASLAATY